MQRVPLITGTEHLAKLPKWPPQRSAACVTYSTYFKFISETCSHTRNVICKVSIYCNKKKGIVHERKLFAAGTFSTSSVVWVKWMTSPNVPDWIHNDIFIKSCVTVRLIYFIYVLRVTSSESLSCLPSLLWRGRRQRVCTPEGTETDQSGTTGKA